MKRPTSKLVRISIWIAGSLLVLAAIYFTAMNIMMAQMSTEAPSGLDYSNTRVSENGLFRVSYASSEDIVPVNQIHHWTLHVETADGDLVENAMITVDGDMPEHGHGLPTRPKVTRYLGNGDYLVEGMKFQMGGWWVMDFTITANSHTDAVQFNMKLN